jgi:hypothetical protein
MRLRYWFVLLLFIALTLTSGCRRRHCCRGGCCAPCCAPCCDTCCGYAPVEGPMPPLAAPVISPQMPVAGSH